MTEAQKVLEGREIIVITYMKGGSIVLCSYNVGTPQVCNLPNFHLVSPSNSMSNY